MTLQNVVERYDGQLTRTDRKVVDELLSNPREGAFLSLPELAMRAEVHPTSAVRLAKKLGYSGYPELRSQLQAELLDVPPPAERVRQRLAHLGGGMGGGMGSGMGSGMCSGSILSALVESEIAALRQLPALISQSDVERAARAIMKARHIYVFGRNHAIALMQLMTLRLTRSGYAARRMDRYGMEIADDLMDLSAKDIVIGFAFTKPPEDLQRTLRHANKIGARTIMISDHTGATLRPNPDILLAASRGARGESQSLTVPMAVCNTLILEISRLDRGRSLKNLEKLDALERKFGK
ncbi:MAG: MurR/RpiR family transcriptional regulator [Alphaproteobacteria bacterium]